jgi:hypothetical protein
MKSYELPGMILIAVQFMRFSGRKAFNEDQFIRIIGTGEKVIRYATRFSPGLLLDLRCRFQNFIPCSRAAV